MVVRERSESLGKTISISFFIFTLLKIPSSHFHTKQIFCLYRSKEYQACLSLYRATADHIFFLQITTSLLAFQNLLWLKKRSCVSKVLISLMVKRRWNGLLDISEQSNLERIYYEQKHVHQYLNLKWLLHIMRRPPPSLTPLCTIFSPFPRPTPWKRARNSCKGGATFEFWFLSTLAPFFVFLCEFILGNPSSFNHLIDGMWRAINVS